MISKLIVTAIFLAIGLAVLGIIALLKVSIPLKGSRNNLALPVAAILTGIINLFLGSIISPLSDLLVMELMFIPLILFGMSIDDKKPIFIITAIYSMCNLLALVPGDIGSFFGMWTLIGTPLTIAIIISSLKRSSVIGAGIVLALSVAVIFLRGMEDPLFIPYRLFSWTLIVWAILGIALLAVFLAARRLPSEVNEDISSHKGLAFEIRRKSVHVTMACIGLAVPIGGWAIVHMVETAYQVDPDIGASLATIASDISVAGLVALRFSLVMFLIPFFSLDIIRLVYPNAHTPAKRFQYKAMRPREKTSFLAASSSLISLSLSMIILPNALAKYALPILFAVAVGDALGAIIGTWIGKRKFLDRTLEGTLAEFGSVFIIFAWYSIPVAIIIAVVFVAIDFVSSWVKLSDNLLLPVSLTLVIIGLWYGGIA